MARCRVGKIEWWPVFEIVSEEQWGRWVELSADEIARVERDYIEFLEVQDMLRDKYEESSDE